MIMATAEWGWALDGTPGGQTPWTSTKCTEPLASKNSQGKGCESRG